MASTTPTSERLPVMSLRMPTTLHDQLRRQARAEGTSVSAAIREAVVEWLADRDRSAARTA